MNQKHSKDIDARLQALGITLPNAPTSAANYVPFVQSGNLVFISGQLPMVDGKLTCVGQVGAGGDDGVSLEQAIDAAQIDEGAVIGDVLDHA
ncbi:MAG: RidA family protein, partial [Rhodospirillales bacterium]|nr:RidA family protein [Rhodospirillales bacterium]